MCDAGGDEESSTMALRLCSKLEGRRMSLIFFFCKPTPNTSRSLALGSFELSLNRTPARSTPEAPPAPRQSSPTRRRPVVFFRPPTLSRPVLRRRPRRGTCRRRGRSCSRPRTLCSCSPGRRSRRPAALATSLPGAAATSCSRSRRPNRPTATPCRTRSGSPRTCYCPQGPRCSPETLRYCSGNPPQHSYTGLGVRSASPAAPC
mmetsp:Transcript_14422/g.36038  ORF Transcript_14422/g.36038 Transcript_14422/m.36038 type:complete len:204 (-) Transcript_14422:373-984(-)